MGRYPPLHMRKEAKPYANNVTTETCPNGEELCVTMQYVGGQYGEVIWKMINLTDKVQYVGLVRGAILQNASVPEYLFGRAFGDVYYLLGASEFIYDTNEIPLYSLAVYNGNTIGFVFQIPPKSVLNVPEYGFIGLQSYTARLVEVKFEPPRVWAIAYSPSEYLEYYSEAGVNYGALPPAYIVKSVLAKASNLGYSFHERIVLEIPNQWVEEGIKLGQEFENFISLLKRLF